MTTRTTFRRLAAAAVLMAGCFQEPQETAAPSEPDEPQAAIGAWPQWRGPSGLGVSSEEDLPISWSNTGPSVLWKAEVPGMGNSSPIVSGNQVVLTSAYPVDGPGKELWRVVLAYDREVGEELWETKIFSGPREHVHRQNTQAAPTAVADGEHYFAYFGSELVKLDRRGAIVWQETIDPSFAEFSHYGAASSPVLTNDAVIVTQDRERPSTPDLGWIAAYDKETGQRLWRSEWNDTCCSYSTPLVVERGGQSEIIFAHSGFVRGYDASNGETLWTAEYPIGQLVSSPMIDGDLLGVSGGAHRTRYTRFFRLVGSGKQTHAEVLWESPRYAPQVSSPVLYNGLVFSVTNKGIMACVDATTGRLWWKRRLKRGHNPVSLVAGDGKVYVVAETGWTKVVKATQAFRPLAENNLDEPMSNASPAIVDGSLLIRTRQHLFRIRGEAAPEG